MTPIELLTRMREEENRRYDAIGKALNELDGFGVDTYALNVARDAAFARCKALTEAILALQAPKATEAAR